MEDKEMRRARWMQRKAKHPNDQNHGKGGFVGGNIRYQRNSPGDGGNRTMGMGKARASRF